MGFVVVIDILESFGGVLISNIEYDFFIIVVRCQYMFGNNWFGVRSF